MTTTVLFAGGGWLRDLREPNDVRVRSGHRPPWLHHQGQLLRVSVRAPSLPFTRLFPPFYTTCVSLVFRLSIQCRYYGTSVEALLVEVLPLPGPQDQEEAGPVRVELRLGSGKCTTKGCVEGWLHWRRRSTAHQIEKLLRDNC